MVKHDNLEGSEVVLVKGGTTIVPARQPQVGHRETDCAHSQVPPPTPTDPLHPGQPETARPRIERPMAPHLPASGSSDPLPTQSSIKGLKTHELKVKK